MSSENYFEIKDISDICGVSKKAIYKWIEEGKIDQKYLKEEPSRGRNGFKILIHPDGLKKKYRTQVKIHLAKTAEFDMSTKQFELDRISNLPDYKREHAMRYYTLIQKVIQFGLTGQAMEAAIEEYNEENPDQKPVKRQSFYRNLKDYKEQGVDALIPDYGNRKGKTKVQEEDYELFKSLYLTQNRRSVTVCWEKTLGAARKAGRVTLDEGEYYMFDEETGELSDTFPTARTFERLVNERMPEGAVILARYGTHEFNKTQAGYFINRDLENVKAGEVWVSDHRQLDVLVHSSKKSIKRFVKSFLYNHDLDFHDKELLESALKKAVAANFSGKTCRLWVSAWIDYKTGKWLSWYVHEDDPNTDHVLLSFKWAVEKYGLPKDIIIDNGKDYRARDVAGGRTVKKRADVDKSYTEGIFYALGIKPHFAIPHNARAKTIERQFRMWIESFEKDFPTYTGKNSSERPEITSLNASRGIYPTAIDLINKFDRFIPLVNQKARNGRELDGLSPEALWNKEFKLKRAMRPEEMKFIAMRSSNVKKLVGNGFYDPELDHHYYNPRVLEHVGERVFIRRDPEEWNVAYIHRASNGEFLFTATVDFHASGLARTEEEKAQLSDKMAHQNSLKKIRKEQLKGIRKISAEEGLNYYEGYIELQNELIKHEHDLANYEQKKVIEMQNTGFSEIVDKVKQLKGTGTDDLEDIVPDEPAEKPKLKSWYDD